MLKNILKARKYGLLRRKSNKSTGNGTFENKRDKNGTYKRKTEMKIDLK